MANLELIIRRIEQLEAKQDKGTITMTEEKLLCCLIERAEKYIYSK